MFGEVFCYAEQRECIASSNVTDAASSGVTPRISMSRMKTSN